jgi:UDP-glucose 4-epimerase
MIKENSRVIVTGGGGFIGSHLVEQLIANRCQVTVIDDFVSGSRGNLGSVLSRVKIIESNLGDLLADKRIELGNYDLVFHLSANSYIPPSVENPIFDFKLNLHDTLMLLEALRHTPQPPRLVYASSAAVYGDPVKVPIQESDQTVPISPYGVSKLAAERYVAVYSKIYGIRANSVRLFSVYGPRQRKQVVYDLLHKLCAHPDHLEVIGDGSQMRDFVYVLDVVQAMLLAATEAPGEGEAYNVASGTVYSIRELVETLCKVCEITPEVKYTGQLRYGDADKWIVDISKLKQLGFRSNTPLEEGISTIRQWYDDSVEG